MYRYDPYDKAFLEARVDEFRDQVARRLSGELTEDEFKPLRLMNGLYLQLHAYMLRVAIPYGVLSSQQMRTLAEVATRFDRGYGHFTTRQNIQYNWIALKDAPDILDTLAKADMHALQTSGNCIRNVTADPHAGVAHDEIEDPRPWAEIIRQWSTLHPEFSFLPRKFKIAITGALKDRAAIAFHDIGIRLVKNKDGEIGFRVYVGGGQGRTPFVAKEIIEWLPKKHLLSYLEAILRAYNRFGRRDNMYKARIKILVHEIGIDAFREAVHEEWAYLKNHGFDLPEAEKDRILSAFEGESTPAPDHDTNAIADKQASDPVFARWMRANVQSQRDPNKAIVAIVLKDENRMPGDATDKEMLALADLAETFSEDEIRVTYQQNLVLPHVKRADLITLYERLKALQLIDGMEEYATDVICCPGLDYCNLANARSLPIAEAITKRFKDPARQEAIGKLRINMSGCINACGHHHAGHIGILGVDKKGVEAYQITVGGSAEDEASIGSIIGRAIDGDKVPDVIERLVDTYIDARQSEDETFLQAWRRVGAEPFKEALNGMD
jgi:sulfite reductase (NADPH) hemoprotein beta-component